MLQVGNGVGDGDTCEIIHLATAENSGQDFVLLGGSQDKNSIRGRLLQGLQEGVERARGEHVHLVDDINGILAYLRRDAHLVNQRADVLY